MQALIDFLIRNLLAVWPVARVRSWEQGLRIRAGIAREDLPPGLHWRWPFVDEVRTWPANDIGLDLSTAAITTRDGVACAVSANCVYRMRSIRAMHLRLWNTETTLRQIAAGVMASTCAGKAWASLQADRPALEAEIREAVNGALAEAGVEVLRLHLTDLVVVRPHRHYLDGARP